MIADIGSVVIRRVSSMRSVRSEDFITVMRCLAIQLAGEVRQAYESCIVQS